MALHCKRFCCCCSLKAGSVFIGGVYTAGSLAMMVLRIVSAVSMLREPKPGEQGLGVPLLYQAAMFAAETLVSVLLIIGALRTKPLLVKTWFVFTVSASVLMVIVIIIRSSIMWGEKGEMKDALLLILKTLLLTAFAIYSFLIVDSFYTEQLRTLRHPASGRL